jgi:paraquat-inducible protein A
VTEGDNALVVCERCARVHRWVSLAPGQVARCVRCAAVLGRGHRLGIETVLALTVTALVVFGIAATTDVLTVGLGGQSESTTVPGTVASAWEQGEPLIAIATAATALVAPALWIVLRLYVLAPIALGGRAPRGFGSAVRLLEWVGRWSMVEVLALGGLISIVRLASLAQATPGPALYALVVLTVLMAAIESAGLKHLWQPVR